MRKKNVFLATITVGLFVLTLSHSIVQATPGQWSANGSSIYYNDGNIGLGTSSPAAKLHITGGSNTSIFGDTGYNSNFIVQGESNFIFRTDRNNDESLSYTAFQDYTDGFIMKVQSNGRVGIMTDNPQTELAVNGTILAKQIIVSTASGYWPDYVFSKDYKLKPLSEVESFIDQNGHLPNIPSASEIEESGQSLAELQRKQMEKIEELTLYLIQQEKEINQLKKLLSINNQAHE